MAETAVRSAEPIEGLILAARAGDQEAFSRLTEPYYRELHVHCYRMLGSFHDAEDLVQETFVRAWRGLATFQGKAHFRSWLYKIATNACLKQIESRPSRVLSRDYGPPADPTLPPSLPVSEIVRLEPYLMLNEELTASGELIVSEALADPALAKRVAVHEGQLMTTDGPFAEVKEQLAGFYLLECESMERAIEHAARVPEASLGLVEVRLVLDLKGLEM